jgi:uncharacterized protein YukE
MAHIGFSASGIKEQSSQVTGMADDLRSVKQAWLAATDDPVSALGLGELVTAFDAMRQAWSEQYDVYIGVVSQLGQGLAATAATYHGAETANADRARSVGR